MIDFVSMFGNLFSVALGAYLGFRFGLASQRHNQRLAFRDRQIRELYGPLVAIEAEIRSLSTVRQEISAAGRRGWQDVCAEYSHPHEIIDEQEERFRPFEAAIDAEEQRFRNEIIPLYAKMLQLFSQKMSLAEEETREWYGRFSRYVYLWQRYLSTEIPSAAMKHIDLDEDDLVRYFYPHLRATLDRFREDVAAESKRTLLKRLQSGRIKDDIE